MDQFQPYRLLLLGRSGVGKSYNGFEFLEQQIKDGIFEPKRVLIMSYTYQTDPSQEKIIQTCKAKYPDFEKFNCHKDIDLPLLKKIFTTQEQIKLGVKQQKERKENARQILQNNKIQPDSNQYVKLQQILKEKDLKLQNWVLVFDDQISSSLIKRQEKDPTLKLLFCVGRHMNISQIWMLQRWKNTIDPSCRDQFTQIAIFKQGNKKALLDLLQDYDEDPNVNHKETLQNLYSSYLDAVESNDGHGCFVINCLISFGQGRLQKNLSADAFYDK